MKAFRAVVLLAAVSFSAGVPAQAVASHVIPDLGATGTANSSSSYPWNRGLSPIRVQYVYDPDEMPRHPIEIKRIRFRPDDSSTATWTGGAYRGVKVMMSTAAVAFDQMTTTFAANHGIDLQTVFNGIAVMSPGTGNGPGTPSPYYVDITLNTPFRYDPSQGPFLLDIGSDGQWVGSATTGTQTVANAVAFDSGQKVGRMYNLTDHQATDGTLEPDVGLVVELTYCFTGTYPEFAASTTSGPTGIEVDFTDQTVSSTPVTKREWDLDGDGLVDSTDPDPKFTYSKAGKFDVSLTVTAITGTFTQKKVSYVEIVDPIKSVPDVLQYQFNEARGINVANTASTVAAPAFGTVSNSGWQGDPSRPLFNGNEPGFGMLAFSGRTDDNFVETGYAATFSGDMSIMWWQRMHRSAPANAFAYVFGGDGHDFRCFNRGAAGNSILYRGATGVDDLQCTADIHHFDWVHLAIVVDDSAGTAKWYVNGAEAGAKTYAAGTHAAGNTAFRVNKHTSTSTGSRWFDLDDFRFYSKALGLAEILGAMLAENAAASRYGTNCVTGGGAPPTISGTGLPTIGNSQFFVDLAGAEASTKMALILGERVASGLPAPLPFLGAGCNQEAGSPFLIIIGTTDATGAKSFQLPVPNIPAAAGAHAYAQYAFDGTENGVTTGLDINVQAK